MMQKLIDILHEGNYSCVVSNGKIRTFSNRGVADLYDLYKTEPEFLAGASVADKVIGKGAAAILAAGKIKRLYADVISEPALALLYEYGIDVQYNQKVAHIENRDKSGWCPLELAVYDKEFSPIMPVIDDFIANIRKKTSL